MSCNLFVVALTCESWKLMEYGRREKEGAYRRRSLLASRTHRPRQNITYSMWVGDVLQIPSFMDLKAKS